MRTSLSLFSLCALGCSDAALKTFNDEPTATITSHSDGSEVMEEVSTVLLGKVSDSNHSEDELVTTWRVDGEPVCTDVIPAEDGTTQCETTLSTGTVRVSLEVSDPGDATGTDSITFTVTPNAPPDVALTDPFEGERYFADEAIEFKGRVTDEEDTFDVLTVTIESDIQGMLELNTTLDAEGRFSDFGNLDEGTHIITVTATDSGGKTGRDQEEVEVLPGNSPPTIASVEITPDPATAADTLSCVTSGYADINGDADESRYEWTVNGTLAGTEETLSEAFVGGDEVVCTVIPSDGEDDVEPMSDDIVISNTGPQVADVVITPDADVNTSTTLTCSASFSDIDGEELTTGYSWTIADEPAGDTDTLELTPETASPGDGVICTATATDGAGETDSGTAYVVIGNTDPVIADVAVSPSTGQVGDVLTCTATASDPDGGVPSITYAWSDGSEGETYTISDADPVGSEIICTATATDADDGTDVGSASATVTNTAPTVDTVTVTPDSGQVGDVLTCSATASDEDDDEPTITYAWSDGSEGETYTISDADPVGSEIVCTATATDVYGETGIGTASATVTNSAPTVDTVTVTPDSGQVGDVLTCSATASDEDDDEPTITYAWSDGSEGETYTISDADPVGSEIVCTATATDVYGETGIGTASATVTNTEPVMGTVTISPDPAYNDDILVCTATATDADGSEPTITYEWTGGATGSELPLTSIIAASGDTLTCTATATDAYGETDVGSASIVIGNRVPTVTVTITPDAPTAADTLTCTASDVIDPDDDATDLTFTWTVGGTPVAASSTSGTITTLAAAFLAGQTVACRADVDDAKGGLADDTASVVIENMGPTVSDVVLTPSDVYTNDTVTAVATASDDDGDTLTLTYAFSVDDEVVQDGPSATLDGTVYFDKGQAVSVTVTADDGSDSDSLGSDDVIVLNSPPTAPVVSIEENDAQVVISAGEFHTCIRKSSSEIDCWGRDSHGQISGMPGGSFLTVSSGGNHSCAITTVGEINCWGSDSFRQVSDAPAGTFTSLAAGRDHHCALSTEGSVSCWGENDVGQVSGAPPGSWIAISAGADHGCALSLDGGITCWGGGPAVSGVPTEEDFTAIGGAEWFGCGLTNYGEIRCWGGSGAGSVPTGTEFKALGTDGGAGADHSCAINVANELQCWGDDRYGISSGAPSGAFSDVTAGHDHTCAVSATGSIRCWGDNTSGQTDAPEGMFAESFLVCTIEEESTDADGDPIAYDFAWDVDGDAYTDTETTTVEGDTIPGDALGFEETWTCEVTPNDSEDDGASGTASFYIEGAPACTGEDQTSIDYPHFGNGTAAPAFDDQRHLSGSIMEGWHNSVTSPVPAYAAIEFPVPTIVNKLRFSSACDSPRAATLQASNDSTDGVDGVWTVLTSDIPAGVCGWTTITFANADAYTMYRMVDVSGIGFVVQEWEMICEDELPDPTVAGCADGSDGFDDFGRWDIAFCSGSGESACADGWHVCSTDEFRARNDECITSERTFATLDHPDCCVDARNETDGFRCDADVARPRPTSSICSGVTKSEPGPWGMQSCEYAYEVSETKVTCCL